ncbi:MAG: WG repeat-containing protein [Gemmatimonadetes bacterium]|nr:WG repeat-containing protein [Gemmatimonadota bacterium]MYB58209.1 WG repeat-containing protein [Gemmatimonadota bacterium]
MNTKGEFVIVPQVAPPFYISALSNGLAVLKIGDKYGYINAKGEVVIEPQFDSAGRFAKTK